MRPRVSRNAAKGAVALLEILRRGAGRADIGEPISQLDCALPAAAAASDHATLRHSRRRSNPNPAAPPSRAASARAAK